jgi:hypothetical protein
MSPKKALFISLVAVSVMLAAGAGLGPAGRANALSRTQEPIPPTAARLTDGPSGAPKAAAGPAAVDDFIVEYRRLTINSVSDIAPAVAYNSVRGEFLVAWDRPLGVGNHGVYVQRADIHGNLMGGETAVDTVGDNWEAAVAYNSHSDEYLVVYSHEYDVDDYDIYARIVKGDGTTPYSGFWIDVALGIQRYPAVAYNSQSNEYLVVYGSETGAGTSLLNIVGRRVAADGTLVGSGPTTIGSGVLTRVAPDVAYNATRNEYLVAYARQYWTGSKWDFDVLGQRTSNALAMLGGELEICAGSAGKQGPPSIAAGPDEYLVAWSDASSDSAPYDICGRLVRGDGTLLGSDRGVIAWSTGGNPYVPQPAYWLGAYLVAWSFYNIAGSADYDVYASLVTTTGGLSAASEFAVDEYDYGQVVSDLACAPSGDCLAVEVDYYYTHSTAEITAVLVRPYRTYVPVVLRSF